MPSPRFPWWCALLLSSSLFVAACADDPPEKEMQQAQRAIEAARAASAEAYAHDELIAAEAALQRARDAVGQRDYRLALDNAIESREQADNAAKESAERQTAVRTEAEGALRDAADLLSQARGRLQAAEVARVAPRLLSDARSSIEDGDAAVQKARAVTARGVYAGVAADLKGVIARLTSTVRTLDAARTAVARRRH